MKKKRFICILFLLTLFLRVHCQDYQKLRKYADSLYRVGNYQRSIPVYLNLLEVSDFKLQKTTALYCIARCYNLRGKKDSAFFFLRKSIQAGYSNRSNLEEDKDFRSLHTEREWKLVVQSVKEEKKALNKDPKEASLLTDDIWHFWKAYDLVQMDTANRVAIYRDIYFEKGSRGLQDYMGLKVRSIRAFVRHYDQHPLFYKANRNNTQKVDSLKPAIYACFEKLKEIYPGALFPDVYFVMGAFTSAGTVSDAGLLIGINQISKTENIPLEELSLWQKNNFSALSSLPGFVSHELIHFEQADLMRLEDTTTLLPVIIEGMADFLGEMISGKNTNQRLHVWAKEREKQIWEVFLKDMDYNRSYNWIANSEQETPDNPADQGYWIGYQICKAYYVNAKDKQQAIYDMLHVKNPKDFLKKSKWEETLSSQSEK